MPTLRAPKTRVLHSWSGMWKQTLVTTPKQLARAQKRGRQIRKLGAHR